MPFRLSLVPYQTEQRYSDHFRNSPPHSRNEKHSNIPLVPPFFSSCARRHEIQHCTPAFLMQHHTGLQQGIRIRSCAETGAALCPPLSFLLAIKTDESTVSARMTAACGNEDCTMPPRAAFSTSAQCASSSTLFVSPSRSLCSTWISA